MNTQTVAQTAPLVKLHQHAELVVRCPILGYSLGGKPDSAKLLKLEAHAMRLRDLAGKRALLEIDGEFRRDHLERLRFAQEAFHKCGMILARAEHEMYMESLGVYSRTVQA